MRLKIFTLAAILICCLSCVETNNQIGVEFLPLSQQYSFHTVEIPLEEIEMRTADGLSGYSSTRITVGAIKDADYGTTTRSSAVTLIPMYVDSLEIGTNPVFQSFHFAAALDTTSFYKESDEAFLQTLNVYEMSEALDREKSYDCNSVIKHGTNRLNKASIVYNGLDSLSFNFSKEYGDKFLALTKEDFKDYDTYIKSFPGVVFEAVEPEADGGRINAFELQLGYDSQNGLTGNFARLRYSAEFKGVRRDTSIFFYYGATDFHDVDSLLTNSGKGSFPQYCLNTSTHQTDNLQGSAVESIFIEGGGGLKPVIRAEYLKTLTENAIAAKGGDPRSSVVNKATIILPFEFPEDYKEMNFWPQMLSPTCRLIVENEDGTETMTSFAGLTDASSKEENQGDVDRSNLVYRPDITYHLQSILRIDKSDTEKFTTKRLLNGSYDTWFLIMANEEKLTTNQGNSDMSEYYNYLAYQSYYNSMYGGYGGYGYGSGYGSYYSNYYSYAMLAAAANQSSTTKSYSMELDKDRFYSAALNGPKHPSGRVPKLKITFGIPKE